MKDSAQNFTENGDHVKNSLILQRLDRIEAAMKQYPPNHNCTCKGQSDLISKKEMAQRTGLSPETIRFYGYKGFVQRVGKLFSWASFVEYQKHRETERAFRGKAVIL